MSTFFSSLDNSTINLFQVKFSLEWKYFERVQPVKSILTDLKPVTSTVCLFTTKRLSKIFSFFFPTATAHKCFEKFIFTKVQQSPSKFIMFLGQPCCSLEANRILMSCRQENEGRAKFRSDLMKGN